MMGWWRPIAWAVMCGGDNPLRCASCQAPVFESSRWWGWIFASTMRVGLLTSWAVCIESGRLRSSYEPAEGRMACTVTWNARWRRSR